MSYSLREFYSQNISAAQALKRLVNGNERHLHGPSRPAWFTRADLPAITKGKQPFATILGCSDSQVSPEVVFDASPGDLFVIRIAGNVLSSEVAGSLQYAGSQLHTPLLVVLGHEGCGAVKAALAARDRGIEQCSRLQILVNTILPALPDFDPQLSPETRLSEAVKSNVLWTREQLMRSTDDRKRMLENRMKIAGAIYDIGSGRVKFLI